MISGPLFLNRAHRSRKPQNHHPGFLHIFCLDGINILYVFSSALYLSSYGPFSRLIFLKWIWSCHSPAQIPSSLGQVMLDVQHVAHLPSLLTGLFDPTLLSYFRHSNWLEPCQTLLCTGCSLFMEGLLFLISPHSFSLPVNTTASQIQCDPIITCVYFPHSSYAYCNCQVIPMFLKVESIRVTLVFGKHESFRPHSIPTNMSLWAEGHSIGIFFLT